MRILIEEYQYAYEDVCDILNGLGPLQNVHGKVSLTYVGYYYNPEPEVQDCVFILPKVILEGKLGNEKVFGHIDPKDLINADQCVDLTDKEHFFIYNLSVWIYRSICVFKDHEFDRSRNKKDKPSIVLHRQAPMMGYVMKRKSNTFLDVLLAIQQWAKDNEHFIMLVIKNIHSGYNKINWTRTISKSQANIQYGLGNRNRQDVSYLNPINKKRQINFDEELLIIFYSILQYMKDQYGFPITINVNFDFIEGSKFLRYINGYGKMRLKQIKYKYFSDKALELWNLCYAFFEHPYRINLKIDQREYLLVKNFHLVFESIIDELIAGDQKLPKGLIDQEDGKVVDHMYQYNELTNNDNEDNIYYIGDSKYYKRGNSLGNESVYKQFTYARNVIQWNIDLFNDGKFEDQIGHTKLRDDVTEGYNVIPNFFISANQDNLEPKDNIQLIDNNKEEYKRRQQYYLSRQFDNRLFDRDTFLLAHYDVNFLFVIALYGRNNEFAKVAWRDNVRKMFRNQIQVMLKKNFMFYAITAHEDVEPEAYIKQNFQTLLGKIYHPFDNRENSDQQYYSLALRKPESEKNDETKMRIIEENDKVLSQIEQFFYVAECELGVDPRTLSSLPLVIPVPRLAIAKQFLTCHYLENYGNASILIGGYKGAEHLNWVFSRLGGKRDDAYNVRIDKDANGAIIKSREYVRHAKFVILYDFQRKHPTYIFRVKNTGEMPKDKMKATGYLNPSCDSYFCYFFDEQISLGEFDINAIIEADKQKYDIERLRNKKLSNLYPEGRPIFMKGEELIKYRK